MSKTIRVKERYGSTIEDNLSYNCHTGVVSYLKNGKEAGGITTQGYRRIKLKGKMIFAHKAAFYLAHGYMPQFIDHINHDRLDNRICNLREAKSSDNAKNRTLPNNNTSKYIGINYKKSSGKWQVRVGNNGKRIHIGNFYDINDAIEARNKAHIEYGFHPNHGETNE